MDKPKVIQIEGFNVEIHDFGYKKYMYPAFNGDAEFEVNKKGYYRLRHFLRTVRWLNSLI